MEDLRLKSSLSMEEIEENFKDFVYFSALMESLREAAALEKSAEKLILSEKIPHTPPCSGEEYGGFAWVRVGWERTRWTEGLYRLRPERPSPRKHLPLPALNGLLS